MPGRLEVGTVNLEVPGLPAGSLTGNALPRRPGMPARSPDRRTRSTSTPSPTRYGVSVRLKGTVTPNRSTGQRDDDVHRKPRTAVHNLTMHFNGGALAPVANPLTCGTGNQRRRRSRPFTGSAAVSPLCRDSPSTRRHGLRARRRSRSRRPRAPTANATGRWQHARSRSTSSAPKATSTCRKVKTTLPPGLVGAIPTVTQCPEAQAHTHGTCPAASQIGTATVPPGSGSTPFTVHRPVYLTGPLQRRAVRAVDRRAGRRRAVQPRHRRHARDDQRRPEHRAGDRHERRCRRSSRAIPLRLQVASASRSTSQGFLLNPTNCGALRTESTLDRLDPARRERDSLSTPVPGRQGCGALAFKPSFKATTSGKDLESQRREPRNDDQPAGRAGEHQVGARAAAQAAALAPDDAAESVPGSDVRSQPVQLPARLVRRRRAGQHADAAGQTDRARRSSSRTAGAAFPDLDLCSKPTACA